MHFAFNSFHRYVLIIVLISLLPSYWLAFATGIPYLSLQLVVFAAALTLISAFNYFVIPMIYLLIVWDPHDPHY